MKWKISMRKAVLVLSIVMLTMLAACGSKNETAESTADYATGGVSSNQSMPESDMSYDAAEEKGYYGDSGSYEGPSSYVTELEAQKIIKTGYYYLETTEFDKSIDTIKYLVGQFNARIANSEESGYGVNNREYYTRNAYFIVRVPAASFKAFTDALAEAGQVVNSNSNEQDVTAQFIDVEARLKTLKVQEERLLDILDKADDLQYIIELEKALSDVRYQIESYESTKRNLEDRVSYSTVEIRLQEVVEVTSMTPQPKTFSEKVIQGFKNSLDNVGDFFVDLTVFLLTASPYLVIFAVLAIFVLTIIRKVLRKRHLDK